MSKSVKTVTVVETKKKGWRIKEYYVNMEQFKLSENDLKNEPNQVQIMMRHFASKFNKPELASQGKILCKSAIDEGSLKTVIDPAVLFAYYARKMEQFGLTLK